MAFKKSFPGQQEHEQIFTVIHRHWFNILSHFVTLLFLALFTLIFFFFAPTITSWLGITISPAIIYFITTTIFLFLWVYGFFIWIDYYFDVWVITDDRIINIEQKSLFTRVASEVNLGKVQDVTTKVEGFIPTLLDYGDLFIQTAGQEKNFHFRTIGDPEKHKDEIVRLVKEAQKRNSEDTPFSGV